MPDPTPPDIGEQLKLNPVGQLSEFLADHPEVRALVSLWPGGGSLDILVTHRAKEIAEERAKVFFEELAKGKLELTPEVVQSEDFIHRYVITMKAAVNTRRREKIRLFARMLKNSLKDLEANDTDEYGEYLSIMDDLSYREFLILTILEEFEINAPVRENEDQFTRTTGFWDQFSSKIHDQLGINPEQLKGMMSRLNRSGCYQTFFMVIFDFEGDKGALTPLYFDLKKLLREEEVTDHA